PLTPASPVVEHVWKRERFLLPSLFMRMKIRALNFLPFTVHIFGRKKIENGVCLFIRLEQFYRPFFWILIIEQAADIRGPDKDTDDGTKTQAVFFQFKRACQSVDQT